MTAGAAAPRTLDAENPWPGLEAFREGDAGFFRGRDAEAEALLRHVRRERLTVLFGRSGLGKSSLLQAGLFPRLRAEGFLPVYVRLVYDSQAMPLRDQVLSALAREATAAGLDAPPPVSGEMLWEHFHRQGAGYWTADNRPVLPVLVLDQFEEAFTLGRETPELARATAAFLEELGDLVEGRAPEPLRARLEAGAADARAFVFNRHPYKVLLALREDFLGQLETLRGRIPSVGSNRVSISALRGDAALLVTGAGGRALVSEDVGERIVRLVAGEPETAAPRPLDELVIDPALLSLFCRELNERRRRAGREQITADLVEGSRDEILTGFYERSIRDLDPAVRRFVEDRLLTVGGYRNSEAVENALATPGITPDAIDALVARRLVRLEAEDGRTRLELTHDVLTGVVQRSRDRRRSEEARAAEKAEAERERKRREARWARIVAAVMSALVVVATVLAVKARRESRRAQEAAAVAQRAEEAAQRTNARLDTLIRKAGLLAGLPDSLLQLPASELVSTPQVRDLIDKAANASKGVNTREDRSRIQIFYSAKQADSSKADVLKDLGYTLTVLEALQPNLATNAVYYGAVGPHDVKFVATSLIQAGVGIKAVCRFRSAQKLREPRIEVISAARLENAPMLRAEDVRDAPEPLRLGPCLGP
jgi:hypothetical protein